MRKIPTILWRGVKKASAGLWKNIKLVKSRWWRIGLDLAAVLLVAAVVVWLSQPGNSQPWTGFSDYTDPTGKFQRGKTLWDWMQLLITRLS
jgi:hypothetical protein